MANNNDNNNNMTLLWIHLSKASTVNTALKMYVPTHCRSDSTASSDLCDKFQGKLIVALSFCWKFDVYYLLKQRRTY